MVFNLPVPALQLAGTALSSHYNGRRRVILYSALQKDLEQTSSDQWTTGEGQSHSQAKKTLLDFKQMVHVFTKQKTTNFSVKERLLVLNFHFWRNTENYLQRNSFE